ncbi:MAG: alpha/beta hydrolase-fold protein [Myxococcota bacterium]|nr:alpha/beta hydrolase-fold protein [Myxococcota bacterium]
MFIKSNWYSERTQLTAWMTRWGVIGQPILILPTAGGDAEEIERFLMIQALLPLLETGKIKVYSVDSVAGQAWVRQTGDPEYRMWLNNQFQEYIRHEVVPAIHMDCRSDDIPIWTTGSSIGAFHAVAITCRYPDVFHRCLGMSGTYDIMRFIERDTPTGDMVASSPLHFLSNLSGPHLDILRTRHITLATGSGNYENVGESWSIANALGAHGVPNYVDVWDNDWHHDWVTWRAMLPKYLNRWTT